MDGRAATVSSVLAVVALWGALEVATRGVRAKHGRIEALWLHRRVRPDVVRAVQRRYPHARLYREREELLANHPLTALAGYTPPRLIPYGQTRSRLPRH